LYVFYNIVAATLASKLAAKAKILDEDTPKKDKTAVPDTPTTSMKVVYYCEFTTASVM
jgi:hypothetical protein